MKIKLLNEIKEETYPIVPPNDVLLAVKLIEEWTSNQTDRDDWVIGGVACRKGFERLLKMYNDLKNENPY